MSEVSSELSSLAEVTESLLSQHLADRAEPAAAAELWQRLVSVGLDDLAVPAELGGGGGDAYAVSVVARACGAYCPPLPLAESVVLSGWLANLGMALGGAQPLTGCSAPGATQLQIRESTGDLIIEGALERVPWAQSARSVVVAAQDRVLMVPLEGAALVRSSDLAGDDRSTVILSGRRVPAEGWRMVAAAADALLCRTAAVRLLATEGAASRALAMSIQHCKDRVQFGQPLARFQAVQQLIAQAATNVAVLRATGHLAVRVLQSEDIALLETALVASGPAVTSLVAIAHQLHGAIGLTREHSLHTCTTRLLAWRDEFGSERQWARRLGGRVLAGSGEPWHRLVTV
jgi:acyl-CoA dehydrogenase